jgi:hypothetical protein
VIADWPGLTTPLGGGGDVGQMTNDREARKLKKIHLLCVEFAETLKKFPFRNKMDEAKARSFLSGIRDVLSAHTVKLESPKPARFPLWKPEEHVPTMDPEQTRAAFAEARRRLKEGSDVDDV